jgi:MoaA/NifB/PqqE/SkfB family radical SAM enzyme
VGTLDERSETLSLKEIKQIYKFKRGDCVDVTGGEPTIHKEFFEIMRYIAGFGPEITLLTNARAFSNKHFLEEFESINIPKDRLRIASAIYGHNEKLHQSMSRTPESFNQTVAGVRNLLKKGYMVEIRVIVTKLNYRYLKEIAEFIEREFPKADRVVFISMKVMGEAYRNKLQLLVNFSEVMPHLKEAIDCISKDVYLFHFPHCVLPEGLRKYSHGRTVPKLELHYAGCCKDCSKIDVCSGLWKTYYEVAGDGELKAI